MKGSAAAARADAVHGTGCSRQCLPSDVSEDQGGRNARARMRRDAPAAEPPAEGRRLGPYRGCAWEGVRMRRSAKAAQGWPAPKSEQKVTCAAPNGCSYTVFCPRTADGVPLDPGPLSTDERAHQGAPNTHWKPYLATSASLSRQQITYFHRRPAQTGTEVKSERVLGATPSHL